MKFIKFNFRNEVVFMQKGDICSLIDEDWFLSSILNTKFNDVDDNTLFINEDKNTAMSLLETIRYNRLIVYDKVSLDYMLALSEKWCLPTYINDIISKGIEEQSENQITDNNEIKRMNILKMIPFKCTVCQTGFKLQDNTSTSCFCHPGVYNIMSQSYKCCGKPLDSQPCKIGYHALYMYDFNKVIENLDKI